MQEEADCPGWVKNDIINRICEAGGDRELGTLSLVRQGTQEWIEWCCSRLLAERVNKKAGLAAQLKQYAEENYTSSMSLAQLARQLHASPVYLGRAFDKSYGGIFIHMSESFELGKQRSCWPKPGLRRLRLEREPAMRIIRCLKAAFCRRQVCRRQHTENEN